jgi:hypothetical protein
MAKISRPNLVKSNTEQLAVGHSSGFQVSGVCAFVKRLITNNFQLVVLMQFDLL